MDHRHIDSAPFDKNIMSSLVVNGEVDEEIRRLYTGVILRYPFTASIRLKKYEKYRVGMDCLNLRKCIDTQRFKKFKPLSNKFKNNETIGYITNNNIDSSNYSEFAFQIISFLEESKRWENVVVITNILKHDRITSLWFSIYSLGFSLASIFLVIISIVIGIHHFNLAIDKMENIHKEVLYWNNHKNNSKGDTINHLRVEPYNEK